MTLIFAASKYSGTQLKNPVVKDFSKRCHLRPVAGIRGSSAEAGRGGTTEAKRFRRTRCGSSRKRGGDPSNLHDHIDYCSARADINIMLTLLKQAI